MPFAATWVDLEITILSEVNQTEKDKYYVKSKIWHKGTYSQNRNSHRHRKRTYGY